MDVKRLGVLFCSTRCNRLALAIVLLFLPPVCSLADSDTGSIRGFLRCTACRDAVPFAGASVSVKGRTGVWQTTTDAHGFFIIFGIVPGKYEVAALKTGGEPWPWRWYTFRYVCVHAGENRALTLDMRLIGAHGFLSTPWIIRYVQVQKYQPDASQTADVYTVGDC